MEPHGLTPGSVARCVLFGSAFWNILRQPLRRGGLASECRGHDPDKKKTQNRLFSSETPRLSRSKFISYLRCGSPRSR